MGNALNEYLDYYLGPTGIPDKMRSANALLNPINQLHEAGGQTMTAFNPAHPRDVRMQAGLNAAIGTLGAASPMIAARIAGTPIANALAETITGIGSAPANQAARQRVGDFATDESGSVNVGRDLDEAVASARQAVLESPNDAGLFADYKAVRRLRDDAPRVATQSSARAAEQSSTLSDYVGQHRAPMRDGGAPAHSLSGDVYPDDIYSSKAVQYYGTGNAAMDRETMRILGRLRSQPDNEVTIYRAVPKGMDGLNAGDWVSINKQYAVDHGESALNGSYDIVEKQVRASDIFTNGDSIQEWGYDPSSLNPSQQKSQEILDMLANGRGADVTDDMLVGADDAYLFDNYDLPMDEASRLARAEAGGFGGDLYHGTDREFDAFNSMPWGGETPNIANEYAASTAWDGGTGQQVYPIRMVASSPLDADLMPKTVTVGDFVESAMEQSPTINRADFNNEMASARIDNIRRGAREEESGPHYRRHDFWNNDHSMLGTHGKSSKDALIDQLGFDAVKMIEMNEPTTGVFKTSNARSRFARFDPRLNKLSNLSAGVGAIGLVGYGTQQENALANIQQNRSGNALNGGR